MSGGGATEGGQDKTHEATPQKLERARVEGDIPRSADTGTFAAYAGFVLAMAMAGGAVALGLGETLSGALAHPEALAREMLHGGGAEAVGRLMLQVGIVVLPLLGLPALVVVAALAAQQGFVVAPKKLAPKLSRINPLEIAKQKFGPHGLVDFAKSMVKLIAIGIVLGIVLAGEVDRLPMQVHLGPRQMPGLLASMFYDVMIGVLLVAAVIAGFDLVWQRVEFMGRMRMSHQELRDEMKNAEGDPWVKQERQQRGRQIATNRMLQDVPGADVVVTNPEHYAVALKWNRASGAPPVCVAKGVDEIAAAIRRRAVAAGVPLHPDPPTARAIHAAVEIGQPIRPEHYRAVAAAIVFAQKLRGEARKGWRGPS